MEQEETEKSVSGYHAIFAFRGGTQSAFPKAVANPLVVVETGPCTSSRRNVVVSMATLEA